MDNNELMARIQALADKTVAENHFVRTAELTLIHIEDESDGGKTVYCLGSDMPHLIFRIFHVDAEGQITEERNIKETARLTSHFNRDIKPTMSLVPPAIEESGEYEIVLENRLENNGVEVKLRSSVGRDVTMIEVYRYYDFRSKVFFVSCIGLSFPGQYLFSVTPDSKHLRLVINHTQEIRSRIDMINELLMNRLLPSYRTIADAARVLTGDAKAHVSLNDKDGNKVEFTCQFVYDDPETQTRYAFFQRNDDAKQGVILTQDIFENNKLTLSNAWTEEQRQAAERIRELMKNNPEEFRKNVTSFFADDLDFRYKAFKDGKLKPSAPAPTAEQTPAEGENK